MVGRSVKLAPLLLMACGGAQIHDSRARPVASVAGLMRDWSVADGTLIEVVGYWRVGFENSYLSDSKDDHDGPLVWFGGTDTTVEKCKPPEDGAQDKHSWWYRVRVIGTIERSHGHYGHLGVAGAQISATQIEYLEPRGPC